MDTTKRPNLQLVREAGIETTTATANSEEDWIEEIDESTLPPNAWQQEVDSLIQLNHEVFEERRALLETEPDSIA
ncbi:MAG TPA: hypothetical protein VMU73_04485 [Gaiellaceae bacterium]|nr:hypothetical protein [Gaiellaceae bacterium]